MTRMAFILSSGRTGTRFLAEFFTANFPGVLARHEPPPSYHLRVLSNASLAGIAPRSLLASALRLSRTSLLRRPPDLYIESNPFLFGFVDVLNALSEQPIVFHIVRDPRQYVRSAINSGSSGGMKRLASTLIPFWFPDVRRLLKLQREITPVGIFAGQWALVNRFLTEHGSRQPNYHLLKFEDIFDAENSGLRRMCLLLGLDYPGAAAAMSGSEKVNVGRFNQIGQWQEWTPEQRQELLDVCGAMRREYGYGGESDRVAG